MNGWENLKNILCVRLDSLGDVLMTTPALRALKQSCEGRKITLLTSFSGAEAAAFVPEIDDVIIYEAPWLKSTASREKSAADWTMLEEIRNRGFDGAVIFTVYSQSPLPSALFCHLADIPRRLAYCRENPYQLLTDWMKEDEPEKLVRHEVRRQLDLAAAAGAKKTEESLSFRVSEEGAAQMREMLTGLGIDFSGEKILMHPGATAASRRYAPASFAEAGRLLHEGLRWPILVTGGEYERELVEEVCSGIGPGAFGVTRLGLAGFSALIQNSSLLISNNTGPVHIAAALGTPVVDLYALTNPQHTPWNVPHRVLYHEVPCKYCYKSVCPEGHNNCLRLVPPRAVFDAAVELLEAGKRHKTKEMSDVYTGN